MRIKKLRNVSNEKITVDFGSNIKAVLPPGAEIENEDITNCSELEDKVAITFDLTEVTENSGKTRLDG